MEIMESNQIITSESSMQLFLAMLGEDNCFMNGE